jgi:hypothetical protein
MQEHLATARQEPLTSGWPLVLRPRVIFAALALLCSVVFPALPIFFGALLICAVGLHAFSPDVRPYVQLLLRVPTATGFRARARLLLLAGAGVLLVVCGSAAANLRGHLRGRWAHGERRREAAEESVTGVLSRARALISAGNVEGAELVLMDADAIPDVDAGRQREVDELLERVRRSRDSRAILDILVRLPQAEFDALEKGGAVPAALDLGERALTYRAVEIALQQLEEARRLRALEAFGVRAKLVEQGLAVSVPRAVPGAPARLRSRAAAGGPRPSPRRRACA